MSRAALSRGLMEAGRQATAYSQRMQEQERYDAAMDMKREQHESDLQAASLRNTQLTLMNNMKKQELNTKQLTQLYITSEGNPEVMSPAISQLGYSYAEEYDKVASAEATKQAGKEMIVVHNGTYEMKPNGIDPVVDPITGKKVFVKNDGPNGTVTRTRAEYDNHFGEIINTDKFLARITANQSQEQLRNEARIQHEERARAEEIKSKTPAGLIKQQSAKLDVELKKKELGRKPDQSKQAPEVLDAFGKKKKLSRQEYDGALAAMKIMDKSKPEWGVSSPDEAYRINQLKNNKSLREGLAKTIPQALASEEAAQQFVQEGAQKFGVPEDVLQDMITKAGEVQSALLEKKGGLMAWIKEFFNTSKKGQAPSAFGPKQSGKGLSAPTTPGR